MNAVLHLRTERSIDSGPDTKISALVLVQERPEPLPELYAEYATALQETGRTFEVIVVLDPRFAHVAPSLAQLIDAGEPVRVLSVGQVTTEAAMLRAASEHCRGSVLLMLPAYRRIEANAIPALLARLDTGADLVLARRWPRQDSWLNRLQSWLLHQLVRRTVGGGFRDVASGVRAMRRGLLQELPIYGDFARFLPVLAEREGYRVEEVDAPQHPADHTVRLYSPGIYIRRILDVIALYFLLRFTEKPLRFFGLVGVTLSAAGGVALAALLIERIFGEPISERPLLLLGVLLVVLGAQAIGLGLVGEIIVHLSQRRGVSYRVAEDSQIAADSNY